MDKSSLQNGQGEPVPAVVLGFDRDTTESQANQYPAAHLVEAAVPSSEKPAKKPDDDDKTGSHEKAPPAGPRDFSSGILDFPQSWSICADAYCCTYCLASAQHNLLMNEQEGIYVPVCVGLLCVDVGFSTISGYLPSSVCFHTCLMRQSIRQRYNLHSVDITPEARSSGCNTETLLDILTVCFCLSCSIAQHQREILRQGEWCGGVFSDRHALDAPTTVHTV